MSNPKLKALGARARAIMLAVADVAERGLRRFYAGLRRKLSPPVHVYRRKGALLIVDAPRIGGRVYVASVSGLGLASELVGAPGSALGDPREIRLAGSDLMIGGSKLDYPDQATAQVAFNQVRKELLPAGWGAWMLRVAALLVACLLVRGLFAGAALSRDHLASEGATTQLHGLAAAMANNPNFVPPDPTPQALPSATAGGDLADQIYRQSMVAAQQTMHDQMPPQPSANVEGLSGFGLEDGPGQGGPGCNPALAFKVDGK